MRRSIGTTAVVAALALAATACGSDNGDDNAAGGGTDGELSGTVTFWDTSGDAEKGTFEELAKGFTDEHPGVTVEYVNVGFDGAQDRFKNAAQAGEAPDVMRTEVAWVSEFAQLGYLKPLDGTAAVDGQDDFLDAPWSSTQYDGATYAVPQVTDTLALFYNKELLEEAGVEVPETLEDIKNSTEAFEEIGVTPLYLRGDDAYWFFPFIYGEGGDLLDAEAEKVTIGEPAGVRAFEQIKDLVDSGAATTDLTDGWDNMMTQFGNGDVAMMINGPWAINDAYNGIGEENVGVAPMPAGSEGQGAPLGGWNYSLYTGSANQEAAEEFIRYMASADSQQTLTEELNLLPTRASVYEQSSVQENEMVAFFGPAVEVAHGRPWIPQAGGLFDPLRDEIQRTLDEVVTPEEAASNVADKYRDLLDGWE